MSGDEMPSALDPVDELAEEYLRRRRRGERPTAAEFAARYPEHAARILEIFPALELIEGLKPAADERPDFSDDAAGGGEPAGGVRLRRLGDYTLVHEIGRGGMGIVYAAEHESLKSRVALKVMHPRFRTDRDYVRRFQTEARSAAKLHHTNIVPVFDYGEQDGVFYYAMQCIVGVGLERVLEDVRRLRAAAKPSAVAGAGSEGQQTLIDSAMGSLPTITRGLLFGRFADARITRSVAESGATAFDPIETTTAGASRAVRPGVEETSTATSGGAGAASSSFAGQPESTYFREIARLGAQVADALDYAHRQGVIHRDIKPPNLLLDAQGNVWVTDFGLAKLVEGDELSQSHNLAGTLRFMAPERFRGVTHPRGDVYSLGATLYELLTLKPVFAERDQARLIDQITHESPAPLRQHDHRIPRDLETVVQKALAKDAKDRFASAAELGDELRRYLESRPILSRPVGLLERFWRWCKRSPGLAAASVGAASLTTILAISTTSAAWIFYHQRDQISRDKDRIQSADRKMLENLFESLMAQAQARRLSRRVGQRFESLDALARATAIARKLKLPPASFDLIRDEVIACMTLTDLKQTGRSIPRPPETIWAAFDSTNTRYALRFRDGTIQVRGVADDREIARFQARGDHAIDLLELSPDGRYLATTHFPGLALTVWDIDKHAVVLDHHGPVRWRAADFSPNSRRIALIEDHRDVLVYELASGRRSSIWNMPGSRFLAFRPDGAQIAVTLNERGNPNCRILESETGRLVRSIKLPSQGAMPEWSPDGTTLATPCDDLKIYLWDAATGTQKAALMGHVEGGQGAAFHPAGTLLASNGWEDRLWLWDAVLGRPLLTLSGNSRPRFSRDGRTDIMLDDQLITYQVEPALEYRTFAHAFSVMTGYSRASISGDGRLLALATVRGVALWDLASGIELTFLPIGRTWYALFDPSGDLLTLTHGSVGAQRWPVKLDPNQTEFRIGPPRQLPFSGGMGIARDATGRIVAAACGRLAQVSTPEQTITVGPLEDCRYVALSPDGQWLATGSHSDRRAQVWHVPDGALVANLNVEVRPDLIFSPDGKWLLAGSNPCQVWAVGTWIEAQRVSGRGYGFSPDQSHLLLLDPTKVLRLVEVETGRTIARLESADLSSIASATFSPDGSRLVMVTNDGPAVHVWDLRAIRKHLAEMGLDWDAPAYPDHDPAGPNAPSLPPLKVDYGQLVAAIEEFNGLPGQYSVAADELIARSNERLRTHPDDLDALHQRGHALHKLRRFDQALADFTAASARQPLDGHLLAYRGICLFDLNRYAPALDQLESAFQTDPASVRAISTLEPVVNTRAWVLAAGPKPERDPALAARMAAFAVALKPGNQYNLNTLGVALYRSGKFSEAITTLEKSLGAGKGESDAFDLFFLAMAHQRLGHGPDARACYDRAVRWLGEQEGLNEQQVKELTVFRAEAEAVLAGASDD